MSRSRGKEYERKKAQKRRQHKIDNGGMIADEEFKALKKFYKSTCLRCGRQEPEIKITIDHVKPLSFGGKDELENAQILCVGCNSKKGSRHQDYRPVESIRKMVRQCRKQTSEK